MYYSRNMYYSHCKYNYCGDQTVMSVPGPSWLSHEAYTNSVPGPTVVRRCGTAGWTLKLPDIVYKCQKSVIKLTLSLILRQFNPEGQTYQTHTNNIKRLAFLGKQCYRLITTVCLGHPSQNCLNQMQQNLDHKSRSMEIQWWDANQTPFYSWSQSPFKIVFSHHSLSSEWVQGFYQLVSMSTPKP